LPPPPPPLRSTHQTTVLGRRVSQAQGRAARAADAGEDKPGALGEEIAVRGADVANALHKLLSGLEAVCVGGERRGHEWMNGTAEQTTSENTHKKNRALSM
jgi:hypothetical protein